MSDATEIQMTQLKDCPADNATLNEAAWQKWVIKNKKQDAARRRRLIRVVCFVLPLIFVSAVVGWWVVSK
jgi:hypothetical protein